MLDIIAKILNYINFKKDRAMEVRNATAPMIENKENAQPQTTSVSQATTEVSAVPHRFEIEIYEADYDATDANGNPVPKWKKVKYENDVIIQCSSKKELDELQQKYAMCDQRFKIVKDLGPIYQVKPTTIPSEPIEKQEIVSTETVKIEESIAQPKECESQIQENVVHEQKQKKQSNTAISEDTHLIIDKTIKAKPKIVTIGDIQLKYDGDKIYQKQWVKLNSNEASMLRLVNDSNNKFVNIQGKHFEMKKWVLVEQTSIDENDSLNFN